MNARIQRICIWGGVPMVVLWLIGFWAFAGFVPPPSPADSPEVLAAMFDQNRNGIRVGLLITAYAATLLAPFFAVFTVQMKRIERSSSPLAYAQLALAALIIIEFIFPLYFLQAAAFRPGRDPATLQTYSDVGWLLFVGVVCTAVLQFLLIAVAILADRRAEPIFPRWFGYFTIWCAIAFAPGSLCVFTQEGPFAWRGLFCWWIPLTAFGVWFVVATPLLLKIVARQEREEAATPTLPDGAAVGAVDLDARRQVELLTAEVSALRTELAAQRAGTAGSAD